MHATPAPVDRSVLTGRPSRARIWFQAVRFFSFTASIIPIVVASALALVDEAFVWWLFLTMLAASVACHAGANLANDYFDHQKGVDTSESLGPSKVIQQGLLSLDQVKQGMMIAFLIAAIFGAIIVLSTGWEIFVVALASLGAAYFYTAGPRPLGYIALGEVTVFMFMGPVMICGAYYVYSDHVTIESVLVALPIGALVAAILHANNIRDIDLDCEAGKVTLATRHGRQFANVEYAMLLISAYVFGGLLVIADVRFWPVAVVVVTTPLARVLIRDVFSGIGAQDLNIVLRRTAGLHLRFGMIMSAALVVVRLIDRWA